MNRIETPQTVELLNGDVWDRTELIEKMEDDEFYYGYCSKTMFSSSKVKLLSQSLKSYYYVDRYVPNEQPLRDGWLFHTAILEPHVFDAQIFCDTLTKGKAFKELEATHGKGNVYTKKEKMDAERLARAFTINVTAMQSIANSQFEVPAFGVIEGIPFRGKADVLTSSGKIIDLKTCQNIKNFRKDAYANGYDCQAYIYCELFDIPYEQFEFIAIDKKTLDIKLAKCSEEFYESGKEKVLTVIENYKTHIEGKTQEELQEIINNYYFEEVL